MYLTSSVASEVVMPTQTIWANCEPGITQMWTTTSTDLSQPTAQADQEVSQQATSMSTPEYSDSTTAGGDGAWIVASSSGSGK